MSERPFSVIAWSVLWMAGACASHGAAPPADPAQCASTQAAAAINSPAAASTPAAQAAASGPIAERAQLLREAADQLDKAARALAAGQKSVAEFLFSSAELAVGPDALASIAPMFREGGPPRVVTPTAKIDPAAAPQPKVAGSSETEDEKDRVPPPPVVGSLTGVVQIGGKPLANAYGLVTLEPASGSWKPRTPKHVVVEQRNRLFEPHITAISVGSTVSFPNFDSVFHNVFSTSPNAAFDLGLYKMGEARDFTFTKEGIVRLGCNLHANMAAYIAVVSAPAYVITDDTGHYEFKRLTPGKYKMKVWSEKSLQPIVQDVTVKQGANTVDIGVTGDAPAGPAPDKFGRARG